MAVFYILILIVITYDWAFSHSVMSSFLQPCGLWPIFCPWDSPGKSTGGGCHFLLQGIFLTQELNPGLPQCRQILYHLSRQGSHEEMEDHSVLHSIDAIILVF